MTAAAGLSASPPPLSRTQRRETGTAGVTDAADAPDPATKAKQPGQPAVPLTGPLDLGILVYVHLQCLDITAGRFRNYLSGSYNQTT